MKAEGIKAAITYFNKFITTKEDKEKSFVKVETCEIDKTPYLFLSCFKNEIGLRYRIELEESEFFPFVGAVINAELQKIMKTIKKSDDIKLSIEDNFLVISLIEEFGRIELKKAKPMIYNWEKKGIVLKDFWDNVMPMHKEIYRKSLYEISNYLFFQLNDNCIQTVNTNEAILVFNTMQAEILQNISFGISHSSISWLLRWSSLSKQDEFIISTNSQNVSFCDEKAEIIFKLFENKEQVEIFINALKNLSTINERDEDYNSSDWNDIETIDINTEDTTVDIQHVRVYKKFLENILEFSGLSYQLSSSENKPIIFEKDDEDTYLKVLLLPIDKNKQKRVG